MLFKHHIGGLQEIEPPYTQELFCRFQGFLMVISSAQKFYPYARYQRLNVPSGRKHTGFPCRSILKKPCLAALRWQLNCVGTAVELPSQIRYRVIRQVMAFQ